MKRSLILLLILILASSLMDAQVVLGPRSYTYYICNDDSTQIGFEDFPNIMRVWQQSDVINGLYGDSVIAYYFNPFDSALVFTSFVTRIHFDSADPENIIAVVNDTIVVIVLPTLQENLPANLNYAACPGDTVTIFYPYVPYGYMYATPTEFAALDTLNGAPRLYLYPDTSITYNLYIVNKAGCSLGPYPLVVNIEVPENILSINTYSTVCIDSQPFYVSYWPENAVLTGPGVGQNGYFYPDSAGAGTHTFVLSAFSGSCVVSTEQSITVLDESIISFGEIDNLCQNEPPFLLQTGQPSGGFYSGLCVYENYIKAQLHAPGPYELAYTINGDDGCGVRAYQTFYIKQIPEKPELLTFGDSSACFGDTVILGASLYALKYTWSSGDTTQYIFAYSSQPYYVSILASNGCKNFSDTTILGFYLAPELSLSSTVNLEGYNVSAPGAADGSIDLNVQGGLPPYHFNWSNGETTEDIAGLNSGLYWISLTDAGGCIVIDSIFLSDPVNTSIGSMLAEGEFNGLKIPNGFTPNGDGFNDTWRFGGLPVAFERNEVLVFDLRGKLVYRMQNYYAQWDGRDLSGNVLPNGDYFWVFKTANAARVLKGNVNLQR
jgi:gliding motility-associated-like protein